MDPAFILEGSGVSWRDLESEASLDPEISIELFDHLARRTPPGFAVRCGRASKLLDFGVVGMAMTSLPTLRHALEHWSSNKHSGAPSPNRAARPESW